MCLLFSIIIPTFNRKEKLSRCLQSIIANNIESSEIIVIDDGSTDGTGGYITANFPWVRYVYQQNKGVSAARNKGMQVANGKYFAFIDSDDMWFPQRLDTILMVIKSLPEEVGLIFNDMDSMVGDEKNILSYSDRCFGISRKSVVLSMLGKVRIALDDGHLDVPYGNIFSTLLMGNVIQPSCAVVRKDVFLSIGGFREELRVAEDSEYFLRVSKEFEVAFVPKVLTTMEEPFAESSLSNSRNNIDKITTTISYIQEYVNDSTTDKSYLPFLKRRITQLSYQLGYHYLTQLDKLLARDSLENAMKFAPYSYKLWGLWGATFLPTFCIAFVGSVKNKTKRFQGI